VIALDPRNASAYVNWGIAERQAGDPDAAMAAYKKALEIDPNYAAAHKNLGDIYSDKGLDSDALESYRQAGEFAGNDKKTCADAWDAHGYKLYEKADYAGAAESLKKALACDDCHVHAVLTLASAYQKLGQVPMACSVLKEAASCRGNDPEIRKALAGYGCK
jgi:Tfp pilus assembly protein PilF